MNTNGRELFATQNVQVGLLIVALSWEGFWPLRLIGTGEGAKPSLRDSFR
jgi:hypothetical protein